MFARCPHNIVAFWTHDYLFKYFKFINPKKIRENPFLGRTAKNPISLRIQFFTTFEVFFAHYDRQSPTPSYTSSRSSHVMVVFGNGNLFFLYIKYINFRKKAPYSGAYCKHTICPISWRIFFSHYDCRGPTQSIMSRSFCVS
jgi:hypothetical protein